MNFDNSYQLMYRPHIATLSMQLIIMNSTHCRIEWPMHRRFYLLTFYLMRFVRTTIDENALQQHVIETERGPSSFAHCVWVSLYRITQCVKWYDWLSSCRMIECESHKIVIFIWHHWQHSGTNYFFCCCHLESRSISLFEPIQKEKKSFHINRCCRIRCVSFHLWFVFGAGYHCTMARRKQLRRNTRRMHCRWETIKRVINSNRFKQIKLTVETERSISMNTVQFDDAYESKAHLVFSSLGAFKMCCVVSCFIEGCNYYCIYNILTLLNVRRVKVTFITFRFFSFLTSFAR